MYTLKVTESKKSSLIEDNSSFVQVNFDILNGENVIDSRSLGFDLGTDAKTIKMALKKYIANYNAEAEMAITNKERDASEAKGDKTVQAIAGFSA